MKRKSETQLPLFLSVRKQPRSKIPRRCRISLSSFVCDSPRSSASELSCVTDDSVRSEFAGEICCSSDSVVTKEGRGKFDSNWHASIDFVSNVEKRFIGNPQTYKEFLSAIVEYSRSDRQETETTDLCVKIVQLLFGHADLIHQFQGFFSERDEKLRRQVRRGCAFAVDDRMVEIEVALSNLRTTIEFAEEALRLPPSELMEFVEHRFAGMKLMGIKRIYGEWSEVMIEGLRKDPQRGLPLVLVRLREKERVLSGLRSAAWDMKKRVDFHHFGIFNEAKICELLL